MRCVSGEVRLSEQTRGCAGPPSPTRPSVGPSASIAPDYVVSGGGFSSPQLITSTAGRPPGWGS
jgi:hypothetical protein